MAVRFRRRIGLLPGVRLNIGKRGVSLGTGMRGASLTLGRGGLFANLGLPGTGLSVRERVSGDKSPVHHGARAEATGLSTTTMQINADGSVEFLDTSGFPLSESQVRIIKRARGDQIREALEDRAKEINEQFTTLETLHYATPPPNQRPVYALKPFKELEPVPPKTAAIGILGRIFTRVRSRIKDENTKALFEYEQLRKAWVRSKTEHETQEYRKKSLYETQLLSNSQAMKVALIAALEGIDWPRETQVDFEITPDGSKLTILVDLPEIEDLPNQAATVPARGWQITLKPISDIKLRKLYMRHVHSIAFRLVGEAFAALPSISRLTLSGYSRRLDKRTGEVDDECLFSARVHRDDWGLIQFNNLAAIDVVETLTRFELRRQMTKTGVFTPISPIEQDLPL